MLQKNTLLAFTLSALTLAVAVLATGSQSLGSKTAGSVLPGYKVTLHAENGLAYLLAENPALVQAAAKKDKPQQVEGITLLAPLGEKKQIEVQQGFDTFLIYFNDASKWMIRVAVGICLVWFLYAAGGITMSGTNSGARSTAINQMKWALAGIIIILFAGVILQTLNSLFFK